MHKIQGMTYRHADGRHAYITHTDGEFTISRSDSAGSTGTAKDVAAWTRDLRSQGFTLTGEGE